MPSRAPQQAASVAGDPGWVSRRNVESEASGARAAPDESEAPADQGGDAVGRVEREISMLMHREPEAVWACGNADEAVDRYTYPLLALLERHGSLELSEISRHLGVTKSTVSRRIGRLSAAGLLSGRPAPRDPRALIIALTRGGMETVHRVRSARRSGLKKLLGCWPEPDLHALALLLERLNNDLGRRHGRR